MTTIAVTTIAALVLIALGFMLLFYSLPRNGKPVCYVGTQWEPYVTILIIGSVGFGVVLLFTEVI
jgi:hypothetical protein